MEHLPAYNALERFAAGRSVVVVLPEGPEGPRRFRDMGARQVLVVGDAIVSERGIEVRPGVSRLPLRDRSVDMVVCIEAFATLASTDRRELVREAYRVLRSDGMFAAWIAQPKASGTGLMDFWTMEDELRAVFERIHVLAQLPWRGFSFAPVLDDVVDEAEPEVVLSEGLLQHAPSSSHYLAIASTRSLPDALAHACVLVPMMPLDEHEHERNTAQVEAMRDELERLREELTEHMASAATAESHARALDQQLERMSGQSATRIAEEVARVRAELDQTKIELEQERAQFEQHAERLRTRETDVAILTRTVDDQERSLARVGELLEERARDLDLRTRALESTRERLDALASERAELVRQLDVAIAEREGTRQLAVRIEAELDLARKRALTHEQQLAARIEEASRLAGELASVRERMREAETTLQQTRSRAEELTASAAHGLEQRRILADIALDRDRLRDEVGKRSARIHELEEKIWETREQLQRERLDHVRLGSDVERLREQVERSHAAEKGQAHEMERLSRELRELEVARRELTAALHNREDEIARLKVELAASTSTPVDLEQLRDQLRQRGAQLAELTNEVEQSRVREETAQALARQREQQLATVVESLTAVRGNLQEHTGVATELRQVIELKRVELEQAVARAVSLQNQVEAQRVDLEQRGQATLQLQRKLEETATEQQLVRRTLREREQVLAELVSTHESSSAELSKLRRALETGTLDPSHPDGISDMHATAIFEVEENVDRADWPPAALADIHALKEQLAAQARRHAEQIALRERVAEVPPFDRERTRRLQREIDVRAEEQEVLLVRLDAAEQRIWEMTDAADRNAARLAASLAQLEKQKEQLDEVRDELEVTRRQLAAEQARALEQERMLSSARAKLARAGVDSEASIRAAVGDFDDAFMDLHPSGKLVDLHNVATLPKETPPATPGAVEAIVDDRAGSRGRRVRERGRPGVVVEVIDEDDGWPVSEPPLRPPPRDTSPATNEPGQEGKPVAVGIRPPDRRSSG